ncbi:Dopey, N-terminal-domain-containing protein [Blakeslea trispora]|nr:Dopey, N-terminal-domain-containing protein [Blakeslea trispora]
MADNENLLSIPHKILKKISNINTSDTNPDTSDNMDSSPEMATNQLFIEQAHQNDPRFKKYVQLVEKNLQSFDAVNEWADIISFLGRLLKSFQAYPQFSIIPRKQLVAKRLAQCLNPGFPAGVHQKTLDVYAFILKTIGPDQLAIDLALWSTGLFPFVQYAATHVKPQLLNIFETYYFPLHSKLRPAMRGFIIALLPALEEEGSEFFDKVVILIEKLSETVELPFFYSCMWLVMISNPNLRPPALNYLLRKLPKILDREAIAIVLGGKENLSLMIRAFAATLHDHQLLVQRGLLELLVQNFVLKHCMIPYEDLVILMRAALGIVLRKDMSLNRRLYAWLLGSDGKTQSQIAYFSQYAEKAAIHAVRGMLQQNTHSQKGDVEQQQRPYKILISLMDKWELGQPIVHHVFMDAIISIKSQQQDQAELLKTANMWMDMVEPYLICFKLFETMDNAFLNAHKSTPQHLEGLLLIEFILDSFKLADDEIRQIHFPFILAALTRHLKDSLHDPAFVKNLPIVNQAIVLVLLLLARLPESVYTEKTTMHTEKSERKRFDANMNILDYVREFYRIDSSPLYDAETSEKEKEESEETGDLSNTKKASEPRLMPFQPRSGYDSLYGQVFVKEITENLTSFLVEFVNSYIVLPQDLRTGIDVGAEGTRLKDIEHELERVYLGICSAITSVAKYADDQFELSHSDALTDSLLKCCQETDLFGILDAGMTTMTYLARTKRLIKPSILQQTKHIKAIMDKLWSFLTPSLELLHMRTVELLWLLTDVSQPYQIETIISNYLIQKGSDHDPHVHLNRFGIVWELSENIPEASTVFTRPIFLILDLLREGACALDRSSGEFWVKTYLKNYVRLLRPFLTAMLDKHILYRTARLDVDWKNQLLKKKPSSEKMTEIVYSIYTRPFDTEIIDYTLTALITLVNFGGSKVLKACKNHIVDMEGSVGTSAQQILDIDTTKPVSFLDLLVLISLKFLETEPNANMIGALEKPVRVIQLRAADLLYLIISRLDFVNMTLVQQIQTHVFHKLLFCITSGHLELQPKLLHLLHASLAITSASTQQGTKEIAQHQRRASSDSTHSNTATMINHGEAVTLMQNQSELFVKCVTDALTLSSNRALLSAWIDFILATLPYIKYGFKCMLVPTLMCICHQISLRCDTIETAIHEKPNSCAFNEKDIAVLLTGLEKILMFCLTERIINDDWLKSTGDLPIPRIPEQSVLTGFAQVMHDPEAYAHYKPRDVIVYHLPIVLEILVNTWHVFRRPQWNEATVQALGEAKVEAILHSFSYAADQAKGRLEVIFEKLFKYSIADFVEGLIEIFYIENPTALELDQTQEYHMTTLDVLSCTPTSTPQHIITTLLDSIRQRTPGAYQQRRRKIIRQGKLSDTSTLRFAEIYCGYIKNPESIVLLWPMIHSFSKDYLSQASTFKLFLPGLMRFLTVSLEELTKANDFDHKKRIRKDAQELYQRCVDYCILIAGKSFDQSLWIRGRSATLYDDPSILDDTSSTHTVESNESHVASNANSISSHNNSSIIHSVDSTTRNVSISNVLDMEKKASWKLREDVMISQVNQYLANQVIPRLRLLVGDNDKINSLLNNLVYYVIGPLLKSKVKSPIILDQLCEMACMPFTYKTWRKEVWEVFIDPRFFYMNSVSAKKWMTIIHTAFSIEKERMTELMARITTTPSTAFFSNRDLETLNRSLNLRRLSFVLFSGTMDQYVPQLPMIQEKIVELLKLEHSEMVHTEIYLCLRVILVRFSQKHLSNFWPVLVTELMRLYHSFLNHDFQDRLEEAQIALAGCKYLDLLCTLELDAFQIYQWIFIRDTVETLIKPQTEEPIPMMEMLTRKMSSESNDAFDFSFSETDMQPSLGSLKRPMLTMRSITSIRQLSFFVEHVGLYVYQSSFTLSKPDLPFIESLLLGDLLEEEGGD